MIYFYPICTNHKNMFYAIHIMYRHKAIVGSCLNFLQLHCTKQFYTDEPYTFTMQYDPLILTLINPWPLSLSETPRLVYSQNPRQTLHPTHCILLLSKLLVIPYIASLARPFTHYYLLLHVLQFYNVLIFISRDGQFDN